MKTLTIPGFELRTAILSGAASTAELEALGADPAEVFAIKTDRDASHLRATIKASEAVEGEARTRRYVFSDERVDRHGDVILAKGWDVEDFAAAEGPILWGHNHGAPPIGKSKRPTRKTVDGVRSLVGDVTFAPADVNPDADMIWRLAEAGFIKTGSVGFKPTSARFGEDLTEKEREKYGLGKWGVLYEGQQLLEFSIVSVPANPGAREIEKGLKWLVETNQAKGEDIDRLVRKYPLTEDQAKARVKEAVGSFFLFSGEAMETLKSLADAADAEAEALTEDDEAEKGTEPETPEAPEPVESKSTDAALPEALAGLVKQIASLVEAVTMNTESATETAKAARLMADSAYNLLERSSEITGERSAGGAASKKDGEGGESGEPGAGELDADALARIAELAKSLTAKVPAADSH